MTEQVALDPIGDGTSPGSTSSHTPSTGQNQWTPPPAPAD